MEYRKIIILKNGKTCTVRNGTEQDARAVIDNFILTHWQTDYLASYQEEIPFTVEQECAYLKRRQESPFEAALVAETDGGIVGTAGIERIGAGDKMKHRASFGISIDRDWWGLGIGRALTEACIECAGKAGYAQLELEVVADNERALALYESEGFTEYGRNPKGFRSRLCGWQETVLMRLELGCFEISAGNY